MEYLLCECGGGGEIGPEEWAVGPQAAYNDLRAVSAQRR
jgi:hypothetical protein